MRPALPRTAITFAAVAALAAAGAVAVASPAAATVSTGAVVNEVYGGGGNSGATLKNDFIELANRGAAAQSVAGWSVQYISANPGATSTWSVTALTGSITAGGLYLVGEAAGAGGTDSLPTPDVNGSIGMSATAGTVALVRTTTALTCKTAAACASEENIVDLVGYGTAVIRETADAPGPGNTTSAQRNATADTDNNAADFVAAAPTPGGSGTGGGGGGGDTTPGPLRVHDIQGTTWLSPHKGENVTNVPGIVTAVRSTGSSKGYWLQDPTPDTDPATSEGVFVFTGSAPTIAVGDSVVVSGKVSDYYPLSSGDTLATTSNLSITEIGTATTLKVSSANPLPAPVVLTPTTVPNTYAPDLGGANIENTPITPARSALDFYESVEGMRIEVDNVRVVGPSNRYGEQFITTKPTQAPTYRGGTELLGDNQTPSGRLEFIPLDGSNPNVSVGDILTGATLGPVDYSLFGGYVLAATTVGAVAHNNLAPVVATAAIRHQLAIATYNVENLAPGDAASKYQRLAGGIITNLATPDVVALEEVQDNTGATNDGVVAADQTLTKLTAAITAAGGPTYSWRQIDPVNDQDGGQPGGNIRVAFLFNAARVSFVDSGPSSVNRSTTGTAVVKHLFGGPSLTLSPGRIDPTNAVWTSSRKPLVGEFRFENNNVFVIATHFNSKLGDQNADGRFQYPDQSSRVQRIGQAQVVHNFVSSLMTADRNAEVAVVGDLNDYQFSPTLAMLRTGTTDGSGPAVLTDLISTLPVNQQYTYVYNGISQVLDHILVNPAVRRVQYQVVHINSEFANQASDHDPQVVDITP